ncbi:MAG: hypothetical protein K0S24_4910 [Sphingobacterium sp.]|jgi:hypothetical protein|nr:hypothetical protein [Sphingobacterium sp.]
MFIQWDGTVTLGSHRMSAHVFCTPPRESHAGHWEGTGVALTDWPEDTDEFNTNIGRILITSRVYGKGDYPLMEFSGAGAPAGPLAAELVKKS